MSDRVDRTTNPQGTMIEEIRGILSRRNVNEQEGESEGFTVSEGEDFVSLTWHPKWNTPETTRKQIEAAAIALSPYFEIDSKGACLTVRDLE